MIQFDGTWEVGLSSISMPDVGTDVSRIMDAKENIVMHVKYRLKDSRTSPETVSLKTSSVTTTAILKRKSEIVDGVGLMQELIEEIDRQVQNELVTSNMEYAYNTQRPTFRWDGQEVLLQRKKTGRRGIIQPW